MLDFTCLSLSCDSQTVYLKRQQLKVNRKMPEHADCLPVPGTCPTRKRSIKPPEVKEIVDKS